MNTHHGGSGVKQGWARNCKGACVDLARGLSRRALELCPTVVETTSKREVVLREFVFIAETARAT